LIAVSIAELGDKTQLSIILLSSKTKKHVHLLLGVLLAFLIVDGIAVAAGSWVTTIIPLFYLKMVSGSIFIFFGILTLLNKDDGRASPKAYRNPFVSSFVLIFLTEWGDKTQIVAALFATTLNPFFVLIGAMMSLSILSVIAIYFGKLISERISKTKINKIAAVLFIAIGLSFFFF
jgi:Ca2+/H+ antiporter, TMEM165/GDT1 family